MLTLPAVGVFKMQPVNPYFLNTEARGIQKRNSEVVADAAKRGTKYYNLCFSF